MVAQVKVKDTSIEVKRFFKKFEKDMPGIIRQSLAKASAFGALRIEERTLQGKDADGNRFRPYAKQTIENRKKAGRKTSFVDLFFSGRMLGSLTFRSSAAKGQIFLEDKKKVKKHFFTIPGLEEFQEDLFLLLEKKKKKKSEKYFLIIFLKGQQEDE